MSRNTYRKNHQSPFRVPGFHLLRLAFPNHSTKMTRFILQAPPLSLAATHGISVDFFSSGYLDVSVPQVRLNALFIHASILKLP